MNKEEEIDLLCQNVYDCLTHIKHNTVHNRFYEIEYWASALCGKAKELKDIARSLADEEENKG